MVGHQSILLVQSFESVPLCRKQTLNHLFRWLCAIMQMNLEYLAIDSQVFHYGTFFASISNLIIGISALSLFLLRVTIGLLDLWTCSSLAGFIKSGLSRNLMAVRVFTSAGLYN